MLRESLKNHNIILASGSPRRQHFFKELDIDFKIDVREVEEIFPPSLQREEITNYLAILKASAFTNMQPKDIIITSDTIVWHNKKAINKPADAAEAKRMLKGLSGTVHEVFTSVCFTMATSQKTVFDVTQVYFNKLTDAEIDYYIKTCKPFDKAGSYGIQDWLGYIGVEKIEGCFFNVMGLPTRLVYKTLMQLVTQD
ncbi:MAG: septum formation protein [Patiriisocius sp.]|jgi:septum formation protein